MVIKNVLNFNIYVKMEIISNQYNINYIQKYNFWINNILDKWININYKCPSCNNISFRINKNKKYINNPVILRCSKTKCKKNKYVR